MEQIDIDDLDRMPAGSKKEARKYSQLLCLHNRIDYRIETAGRTCEIAAKTSIAPVCRDCGIAMHFENVKIVNDDATKMEARLVPGVGGECVPAE